MQEALDADDGADGDGDGDSAIGSDVDDLDDYINQLSGEGDKGADAK